MPRAVGSHIYFYHRSECEHLNLIFSLLLITACLAIRWALWHPPCSTFCFCWRLQAEHHPTQILMSLDTTFPFFSSTWLLYWSVLISGALISVLLRHGGWLSLIWCCFLMISILHVPGMITSRTFFTHSISTLITLICKITLGIAHVTLHV